MATFTKSLEQAISQAFKFATEKKHQYVTLEHLLLALTDETDARNVMKACNVDVDLLNENLEFYRIGFGNIESYLMMIPKEMIKEISTQKV